MITAQIGLVPASANWGSYVVQWVAPSAYTHAVIAVNETVCWSYEPGREGARLRPISDYPGVVWSRFRYTREQRRIIVEYAYRMIGARYGWADYLLTGLSLITHVSSAARVGRQDRTVCSQAAVNALRIAGITLQLGGRTRVATPADLGRYWHEQGWATTS